MNILRTIHKRNNIYLFWFERRYPDSSQILPRPLGFRKPEKPNDYNLIMKEYQVHLAVITVDINKDDRYLE